MKKFQLAEYNGGNDGASEMTIKKKGKRNGVVTDVTMA